MVARSWPPDPPVYEPIPAGAPLGDRCRAGPAGHGAGGQAVRSMFPLYRGFGARLLRALSAFALDSHADAFEEVRPPTMVLTETMVSTGHLPEVRGGGLPPRTGRPVGHPDGRGAPHLDVAGDILDEADLPLRLTAATACFRRRPGAAGRDTRGLLRVHEFDKVELFAYATPEQAPALLADIVARAERLLRRPGPPVPGARPVRRRHGQLGGPHLRPRGLLTRGRPVAGGVLGQLVQRLPGPAGQHPLPARGRGRPGFVHTLNGSALAWARIWAALVETGRQADGSVVLPEVLAPYLRGETVIPAGGPSRSLTVRRPGRSACGSGVEPVADPPDGGDQLG